MPLRHPYKKVGTPREITLPSGNVVVEHDLEQLPGYGRNNTQWKKKDGWSPDMQHEQADIRWDIPDEDIRRGLTDPACPVCPLSRFIGNMEARKIMQRAAFAAWSRDDHCFADLSFALVGPASSGKTTLARLFAETVLLPFVEIPPRSIRDPMDFYDHIEFTLERTVNIVNVPTTLKMVPPGPT